MAHSAVGEEVTEEVVMAEVKVVVMVEVTAEVKKEGMVNSVEVLVALEVVIDQLYYKFRTYCSHMKYDIRNILSNR